LNKKMRPASPASFASLGLAPAVLGILEQLGYEEPTPIQRDAIPPLLAGRDLVGHAGTGTGKTAAFALPLLQRVFGERRPRTHPGVLVLVPTRELAMQVAEAMHRYGRGQAVRVLPVYGGQSLSLQLKALRRGVDVVVATPGRALDHIRRTTLDLGHVEAVVLDEADEMLDMGFAEDLEAILEALPEKRQTALFSATMPRRIAAIAARHLHEPVDISIPAEHLPKGQAPRVRQAYYVVSRSQKVDALGTILDLENPGAALIFCRTRNEVEELAGTLQSRGYRAEGLHGGMSQKDRDRVMGRFREGATELVLATDVAARGLDIGHLSHVVNFDVPSAPESYVHRIGRTGRAGREGVAITLAEPRERPLLKNIERLIGRRLDLAVLPTVADLRARRMDLFRASLREAVLAGGTDPFRAVVETLAQEFDLLAVAAAAVKLAHDAGERPEAPSEGKPATAFIEAPRRERPAGPRRSPRPDKPVGSDTPVRSKEPAPRGPERPRPGVDVVRVYVSAGREAGVRPADLVGAITGEAGLQGSAIGAIQVADRFSLVEVPEGDADTVLAALRGATIRGKKVTVSRYREPGSR
jgi:ATP-dependent RNA helicase DeaD